MKPILLTSALSLALTGCTAQHPPMETVDYVDLERFMGDWYVIAHIPTFVEDEAYNAIENYRLNDDGTIATTFTFRQGGFDGKRKRYTPKGFVRDEQTQAEWGMQFIWPIKGDYRVIYLDDDYRITIIGRNKRDYVWLMARQPQISEAEYSDALKVMTDAGYDLSGLRKVPQQW